MNPLQLDCELSCKATAALRQEIIRELTQPDKSISLLLEEETETDEVKNSKPPND